MFLAIGACGPSVSPSSQTSDGGGTTGNVPDSASGEAGGDSTGGSDTTGDPGTTSTDPLDGGDDNIGDDDGGFLCHCTPDGGTNPFECDVFDQDCPRGSKCVAWANDGGTAWNATRCTEVDANPAAVGEACMVQGNAYSGVDDCESGAFCWNVDPLTNEGVCVAQCTGSYDDLQCADGSTCFGGFDGAIYLCLAECSPLEDTCAANEGCIHHPGFGGTSCVPDGVLPAAADGEPCSFETLCAEGLACLAAAHVPACATEACCSPIGSPEAPPLCPAPEQSCIEHEGIGLPPGTCACGIP